MAGTGHSWEIANMAAVRAYISDVLEQAELTDQRVLRWFTSRKMLKHLTAADYLFPLSAEDIADYKHDIDPSELPFIQKKLDEGGDVRMFSPQLYGLEGPDLGHVCDWLRAQINDGNTKILSKLDRISVADATQQAHAWTVRLNKASRKERAGSGSRDLVLATSSGHYWYELKDQWALDDEGRQMNHCVWSYTEHLDEGSGRFFSLRSAQDKPFITAHFSNYLGEALQPLQIRGRANDPVPLEMQADVVELLQHLGAGEGPGALHAGCVRLQNGQWQRLRDSWDELFVEGLRILRGGSQGSLYSPRKTDLIIAHIIWGQSERQPAMIRPRDDIHLHIDDLRAVALLKSHFNDFSAVKPPFLLREGSISVCYDIWEEQVIEGRTILVNRASDGKFSAYMTDLNDRARILMSVREDEQGVFHHSSKKLRLTATIHDWMRWKRRDARNAVSILNGLNVASIQQDSGPKNEFYKAEDGWHLFTDEATSAEAVLSDGLWKFTDYQAVFYPKDSARSYAIEIGRSGLKHSGYVQFREKDLPELVRFLNKQGIAITTPHYDDDGLRSAWPAHGRLFHFDGHVHLVKDCLEAREIALKALKRKKRLARFDPVDTANVLTICFPDLEDLQPQEIRLLMSALTSWARHSSAVENSEGSLFIFSSEESSTFWRKRKWHQNYFDRLGVAARFAAELSPAERKAFAKPVRYFAKLVLKNRKQLLFPSERMMRVILLEWQDLLPDGLFARCVKFMNRKSLCDRETSPSTAWRDVIFPRAREIDRQKHSYLSGCIVGAAECSSYSIQRCRGENFDAAGWLSVLQMLEPGRLCHGSKWGYLFSCKRIKEALEDFPLPMKRAEHTMLQMVTETLIKDGSMVDSNGDSYSLTANSGVVNEACKAA